MNVLLVLQTWEQVLTAKMSKCAKNAQQQEGGGGDDFFESDPLQMMVGGSPVRTAAAAARPPPLPRRDFSTDSLVSLEQQQQHSMRPKTLSCGHGFQAARHHQMRRRRVAAANNNNNDPAVGSVPARLTKFSISSAPATPLGGSISSIPMELGLDYIDNTVCSNSWTDRFQEYAFYDINVLHFHSWLHPIVAFVAHVAVVLNSTKL